MLSVIFHSYLQQSKTACLYRVRSEALCPTLSFPHVHTVSLIHCTRNGVSNVLTPHRFPNLKTVHYLSAHPGQADIYRRFSQPIEWVFPNRDYVFYNCMLEAGLGRVENRLIRNYIHKIHNHPYNVRINLPGYGGCDGEKYRVQMLRTLQQPYQPSYLPVIFLQNNHTPRIEYDSDTSLSSYLEKKTADDFFKVIMDDCEKEEKNSEARLCHYP